MLLVGSLPDHILEGLCCLLCKSLAGPAVAGCVGWPLPCRVGTSSAGRPEEQHELPGASAGGLGPEVGMNKMQCCRVG